MFGWSFYADASAEHWAQALLDWAERELGVRRTMRGRMAAAVLTLLETVPLVVVLDGLEALQEGPEGAQFGRLLDGTLREVLTGACRFEHAGLVLLTSRFAFADLEAFDGGSARILNVPPFTPDEGAALLLASGGNWLTDDERRDLVEGVDGHALAVAALGALLADRPPANDLAGLRAELAAAASTNVRVAKVLRFYADRLSEADRYLVAAVALFAHPVTPEAVLAVSEHASFGGRLAKWTPGLVEAAAGDRLEGLLSWHPDGTLSAHPLVRDTFRPLALGAAEVAAETTLTEVAEGAISNREDGLRVVEATELLLEADQWEAADDLWKSTNAGNAWVRLPAARLGQRAASAFVATPARRQACSNRLGRSRLGYYLNAVGLNAMNGGDLVMAQEYLNAAISSLEDTRLPSLAVSWRNLAECFGLLGEVEPARRAAATAVTQATAADDLHSIAASEALLGMVSALAGDSREAEQHFLTADRIEYAEDPDNDHMYSMGGIYWAEFLANTGRPGPARTLTERNREISVNEGRKETVAYSDRLLGHLDLAAGDTTTAQQRLTAAAVTFRDGDYLADFAATLPILADCVRASGDLSAALRYADEALTIAAPRGFRLSQSTALAVRARTYADRIAAGSQDDLGRGRDAAETAHRIAIRRRLTWGELDALNAHADLDRAEGVDRGWSRQAAALRARLIPAGLDPDPFATVERLVTAERVREDKDAE